LLFFSTQGSEEMSKANSEATKLLRCLLSSYFSTETYEFGDVADIILHYLGLFPFLLLLFLPLFSSQSI
jgi:hypothetical protein